MIRAPPTSRSARETLADEHAVIFDIDKLLPLHRYPYPAQAGLEYSLIDRFEKAGPEVPMDPEAAIDRQPRTFFDINHAPLHSIAKRWRGREERDSREPLRVLRVSSRESKKQMGSREGTRRTRRDCSFPVGFDHLMRIEAGSAYRAAACGATHSIA
jgi:hypothetical protein